MPKLFYKASSHVSTRTIGSEGAVLYHPDTNQERLLNDTGLFIWQRLDGSYSLQDIADDMMEEFADASPEAILKDLCDFLADLSQQDYVSASEIQEPRSKRFDQYPDMQAGPQTVDISLTGKCNLHCHYCFYADEMASREDLPDAPWVSFFEELGKLAVRDICLSGGEIFLRPNLWPLIDSAIANRMRYSVLTNGTLITEETVACFEQGLRRQRLNSIQVSIDGSCPDVHDRSRGKGSFAKAIRGLRLLKEADLPVTSRVTVNRHNVDDLENIARLLLDDIGLEMISTNDAVAMGAGCFNQEAIILRPPQQLQAMKTLAQLAENYNGRVTAMAGPLAKWRMYHDMELARTTGEKAERWQMGQLTACGCVLSRLSVHHDGTITPCTMLAKLELGRINQDSVREIWKTHPIRAALKNRRTIPMTLVPGCEDCEWAPYCNGSCPGLPFEMTGDLNRANPYDCYRRFAQEVGRVIAG